MNDRPPSALEALRTRVGVLGHGDAPRELQLGDAAPAELLALQALLQYFGGHIGELRTEQREGLKALLESMEAVTKRMQSMPRGADADALAQQLSPLLERLAGLEKKIDTIKDSEVGLLLQHLRDAHVKLDEATLPNLVNAAQAQSTLLQEVLGKLGQAEQGLTHAVDTNQTVLVAKLEEVITAQGRTLECIERISSRAHTDPADLALLREETQRVASALTSLVEKGVDVGPLTEKLAWFVTLEERLNALSQSSSEGFATVIRRLAEIKSKQDADTRLQDYIRGLEDSIKKVTDDLEVARQQLAQQSSYEDANGTLMTVAAHAKENAEVERLTAQVERLTSDLEEVERHAREEKAKISNGLAQLREILGIQNEMPFEDILALIQKKYAEFNELQKSNPALIAERNEMQRQLDRAQGILKDIVAAIKPTDTGALVPEGEVAAHVGDLEKRMQSLVGQVTKLTEEVAAQAQSHAEKLAAESGARADAERNVVTTKDALDATRAEYADFVHSLAQAVELGEDARPEDVVERVREVLGLTRGLYGKHTTLQGLFHEHEGHARAVLDAFGEEGAPKRLQDAPAAIQSLYKEVQETKEALRRAEAEHVGVLQEERKVLRDERQRSSDGLEHKIHREVGQQFDRMRFVVESIAPSVAERFGFDRAAYLSLTRTHVQTEYKELYDRLIGFLDTMLADPNLKDDKYKRGINGFRGILTQEHEDLMDCELQNPPTPLFSSHV